jgi:hypothetical protein
LEAFVSSYDGSSYPREEDYEFSGRHCISFEKNFLRKHSYKASNKNWFDPDGLWAFRDCSWVATNNNDPVEAMRCLSAFTSGFYPDYRRVTMWLYGADGPFFDEYNISGPRTAETYSSAGDLSVNAIHTPASGLCSEAVNKEDGVSDSHIFDWHREKPGFSFPDTGCPVSTF